MTAPKVPKSFFKMDQTQQQHPDLDEAYTPEKSLLRSTLDFVLMVMGIWFLLGLLSSNCDEE
ncbi:hypothetical protein [Vibrio ulleungensis]|uniref:Uncharacterized protein n=1 Tax=Vibrio ulleungensis TaxID=2807619 RepID=A0ABS2HMV9_9VIBR|nr:hypothetical protein [Vibrio ulleungensis]MBM7037216.1 hypothetical protein [Vibrio ulleungensis]